MRWLQKFRRAMCGKKIRYSNEASGEKAVLSYERDFGQRLIAYQCLFCRGWHIGHPK